ncbi:hypothetical protein DRO61_08720 [Candidatus Bathyarchaeota archaeon]|nr:MAG: hypothetical protein DRO61_08720 [Candidatus Bathyarchaeota archaeon]
MSLNKMAYTKKVMSGRTYWYKDGKRIAVAKVPDNVKNGKKPSGKKPSGKKPSGKKPSIKKPSSKKNGNGRKPLAGAKATVNVQKECRKASKHQIMELLSTLTKDELCKLVDQIPKAPKPVSASMKKKLEARMAKIVNDTHSDPNACDGEPMLRCQGVYCSKSGSWACP